MIKFTGTDTSKKMQYTAEAETYKELFEKLIEQDIMESYWNTDSQTIQHLADYSEELETILDQEDYENLEQFDFDKLFDSLSATDWQTFLRSNNSQAYYQEFEEID